MAMGARDDLESAGIFSVRQSRLCLTVFTLVEIRFAQAARKHRIGRASVRHVMANSSPVATTTTHGNPGWLYIGLDERGRELEIVAVELSGENKTAAPLLVIHVMPSDLRGSESHG